MILVCIRFAYFYQRVPNKSRGPDSYNMNISVTNISNKLNNGSLMMAITAISYITTYLDDVKFFEGGLSNRRRFGET